MSKLKTLKDFDPEPCCHGINKRELKKEAIIWVQVMEEEDKEKIEGLPEWGDLTIAWVKEFFNLTKEDFE